MIKKLKAIIEGTIKSKYDMDSFACLCEVSNLQTDKINELIKKVNELETKLQGSDN